MVQSIQMPRHRGLRAAGGKMLKSFTTVYCTSGRRFAAVPKTSGERRRRRCTSPQEVCCSTRAVCSRIVLQFGQLTKWACCAPLSPGAKQATPVLCRDPYMLHIGAWMDIKMPWSLEQGSCELCLGSEQDREILDHLPVSQPLGLVRDKKHFI